MPGHLNNAGMWTPPEGQSPRIDAFLFYATDKYPALDPVGKIPEFKYCAVRVTPGGQVAAQSSFGGGQLLAPVEA